MPAVGRIVEIQPQPGQAGCDPRTDLRRALPDPRGEDDAVEPAEDGRQRPGLADDPIDEIINGQARGGRVGGQQVAHVVADARKALEAAFVVEEAFETGAIPALFHEIKQHAGIELPRPRPHGETIERREGHGAVDAPARLQRTHRGAVAEMGHDHPACRQSGRDRCEGAGDIFVGDAVKAIAAHPLLIEGLRDGEMIGDRGMAAVEGGVEAGDLGRVGQAAA